MATITAADVNKLRTATGAGMMDCKKALVEADGDFDLAIENLRKRTKVAANRSDRESTEGAAIAVNADKTAGVVITLNCETDFVGMNESFVKMATEMANQALNFDTKEAFLASDFNGITIDKLIEQTGVIGEN
jgi:elongation factor Ts